MELSLLSLAGAALCVLYAAVCGCTWPLAITAGLVAAVLALTFMGTREDHR